MRTAKVRSGFSAGDVYWISAVPSSYQRFITLMVSFVNFRKSGMVEGLRLLIVDKTGQSGNIMVKERQGTITMKQGLARKYEALRLAQPTLEPNVSFGDPSREMRFEPLTIVLECTLEFEGIYPEWALLPFQPCHPSPDSQNLRIIFDQTYTQISDSTGLRTTLEFQTDQQGTSRHHLDFSLHPSDYMYLSVIRRNASRVPSPPLPTHIITSIAEFTLGHYQPFRSQWNTEILSLGLVNRSWVHILDIRWRFLGSGSKTFLPDFTQFKSATNALRRGLSARASRYIKSFDISNFSSHRGDRHLFIDFAVALMKNSKDLVYLHIDADIFVMAKEFIPTQQGLIGFQISVRTYDTAIPSLKDVCLVIGALTQLRVLRFVMDPEKRQSTILGIDVQDNERPTRGMIQSRVLEELTIVNGSLCGSQLIHMLPGSANRLHNLLVHHTVGLTANDINTLLAVSHPTLARLQILDSIIPADNNLTRNVSYPLDNWVDKMKFLSLAIVPGSIASFLSLFRKEKMRPNYVARNPYSGDFLSQIVIHYDHADDFIPPIDKLKIQQPFEISELLTAVIERTGWDMVTISVPASSHVPMEAWRDAIVAACNKGMKLRVTGVQTGGAAHSV